MIFRRIIIAIKKVKTDNQFKSFTTSFLGFGLLGFSIYILISLLSYNAADSGFYYQTSDPVILNLGGPLGAVISDFLLSTIGIGSYLLLALISLWSFESIAKSLLSFAGPIRLISGLISLVCFMALSEFYISGESFPQGSSGGIGGKFIFLNLV